VGAASTKVSIVIEKDDFGYPAYCPELRGCYTQGDPMEEVLENIREAVELDLETLAPEEKKSYLSREVPTTSIEGGVG